MNESKLFYIELKERREATGISLEDISESTKIDIKYYTSFSDEQLFLNIYKGNNLYKRFNKFERIGVYEVRS